MSTSLLLSTAQDAQDFLYFLLERASEELKEVSHNFRSITTVPPQPLTRVDWLIPRGISGGFGG
jgi:hypothetical protein